MSSKRPAILMGVLLLALAGYFVNQQSDLMPRPPGFVEPPIPGKNAISNLKVTQDAMGTWTAEFDYFYTGEPNLPMALIELSPLKLPPGVRQAPWAFPHGATFVPSPKRGSHHVSIPLMHPGIEQTTQKVTVTFSTAVHQGEFATQQVDQLIDWPSGQEYGTNQYLSKNTPAQNLRRADDLINFDTQEGYNEAQGIVEKLLHQNPRFDAAYVELARLATHRDDGPEGWHQAEGFLQSALDIRPDSPDAKTLLGYVYTKQRRFAEAETLYQQVAASNTSNPWLWAHWGDQLAMQHRPEEAIAKYREAIARPPTQEASDRGRKFAYRQLLAMLGRKKDLDAMEVVFKQQVADYGPGSCYSTDYARFMLQVRGDAQGAIDLSKRALNKDCNDAPAREVLGLAQYVKWADATGPERAETLNEARLYLPVGPTALYQLATSDRTVGAAKQLLASGERIDQKDSSGRTALSIALEDGDLAAARRLLVLHARGDAPVGPEDMPLALAPVLEQNLPAIRLLREFGVNYSTLKYRGHTAIEFAKQSQNRELLQALGGGGTAL